ncbi:MAG TPA: hypothetical protein VIU64_17020 [Polyangia bacterium]
MARAHWVGALSMALGATLAVAVSRPVAARPGRGETIGEARRQALGDTVTVTGTVTVPTNVFDGGFALQQEASGIYVLDSLGGSYELGARVEVTGVLADSSGLLAIQPTKIRAAGRGRPVEPACASTSAVGEATEGRLLHLHGTMRGALVDDSPYGFKLDIDDGSGPVQVFLYPGTGISTAGLVDGADLSVVCFSSQFETHYECDPREPSDLHVGNGHHP